MIGVGAVVGRWNGLGRLAFFRRTADVHRHRLAGFNDFTCSRQLKQNGVGFRLIAGPRGAHAKLEIGVGEYLFRLEPVFADDVRNTHFRTAQREINGRRNSEEKNDPDRDHNGDAAEYGYNSGD